MNTTLAPFTPSTRQSPSVSRVWFAIITGFVSVALAAHGTAAGGLDPGFDPDAGSSVDESVNGFAVQPDGKIVIAGGISTVSGQTRNNIARLHADGTLESTATFDVGTGANDHIAGMALQFDGKIVLGGLFTTVNGLARNYIARLKSDGSVENTVDFNPGTGANDWVLPVALQTDGKILLGGHFTTVNGLTRNRIARLNANGIIENTATFNPGTGVSLGDYTPVVTIAVQPDGKVLIGGFFSTVNGLTRNNIARLHPDGTVESTATFNPGTGADEEVTSIAVQPDGKILIGGHFTSVNGLTRNRIARLNADGTVESTATFDPGTGTDDYVQSMVLQADGKILIGGGFTTVNGLTRNHIARLHPDGSVESTATFDTGTGANDYVRSLALQADGKILLGGDFTSVNGQTRNHIARLDNDAATQSLTIPSSARVQWLRGGASPEIGQVLFDLSTNGGTIWNTLGPGTRIAGGWELTGLSLPASGIVRARGRTTDGGWGSSGLVGTELGFPDSDSDGLLDTWEQLYWGTTTGHSASDDFDQDGLTELMELAFGLDPTVPDAALQPTVIIEGTYLTITITKHPGVTYKVETGGTLLAGQPDSFFVGTTHILINDASTLKVRDTISYNTPPGRFMRVVLTAAP